MSWSLDWFAAEKIAKAGTKIRRVGWTDHWLIFQGLWFVTTDSNQTLVKATDFTSDEFNARDWTDQPVNADPCVAVPAFNTMPIIYGRWTDQRIFIPPPIPGFSS